jgi:signal transduction histidine kinase
MSPVAPHSPFRFSVQAKVLLVVLGFLVLVPAVTMWIVDDRLGRQMREEARQTLETAEAVFRKSLDARADNFLSRYRSVVGEARFKVTASLPDAKTMSRLLRDLAANSPGDHEVFLFSKPTEGLVAGERRELAPEPAVFARAAASVTAAALAGGQATGSLGIDGHVYNVVAVPVENEQGEPQGALTVGVRLGVEAFRELRLPGTEVLLLIEGRIAASSFNAADRAESVRRQFDAVGGGAVGGRVFAAEAGGEHFLALGGDYGARRGLPGFRYVLLSSYEPRLRALDATRSQLLGVSVAGIVLSTAVVWFFVRRVTRPLVELRDSAEAVGRGDFSRRIERFSDDEVGDLAQEFNRMTGHLQASRAELERALQTVKATQSQLIQSEKLSAVGQFVAGVAHELNNPLTSVIGFSEILQGTETDEKSRGFLERIVKSAHRCHKIVSSLLSFARQHPPERKLVALHALADEVLDLLAYELRTSNITVVKEYAPALPLTLADAHQLEQVFVNILGNARQAIEPFQREGRITVRTRAAHGRVVIEFADNGPGIRPEHLARIFDPFFTTKPVGKGTGLGLSLVYGIVQEHGGTITARSEVGHGATFAIELPVANAAPAASALRSGSAPPFASPPPALAQRTVLVIDDEDWILELAAELLRRDGYLVETAVGGEKALELLGRIKFDLIVSDWKMPGLNGVRLYEHLCVIDPAAAAHMLFMTGDVVSDTFQDFLRDHRLTCLSKPFAIGEFRAAVTRMTATIG